MKRIHANRVIEPGEASRLTGEVTSDIAATQVSEGFSKFRVTVDAQGREHSLVPLPGPKHKPSAPYLIAHFSLPPPKEREALLDELARTFARAAVDELLKESALDTFSD